MHRRFQSLAALRRRGAPAVEARLQRFDDRPMRLPSEPLTITTSPARSAV